MDPGSWFDPSPKVPRSADVRASDAEREAVVDRLRTHFAEGRLDHEELEERVEAAYRAKMRSELDGLLADLPAAVSPPESPPSPPVAPPSYRPLLGYALRWVVIDLGAVAIWAASGLHQPFWPEWLLLGSGLLVGRRAARRLDRQDRARYGPCRPRRWESQDRLGRGSSARPSHEDWGPRHLI